MTSDDPLRTRREVMMPVTAELAVAGFDDAVEIGRGGFGVVYRCRQVALDRTVAVKILTAVLDADNQARFVREQRAMGRLTGLPNIVTVLEVGVTASGRPYLVMPYYPLDSLDAWIRKNGPLPIGTALSIGTRIAGALERAHRLGVVHRDVKPGNILLTHYGEPALTDFGIAHVAGGFQTAAGTFTGSPAFTAPEVLEGESPTEAGDVYGLGATLFCALTGHAAFERRNGETVVAQFLRITTQPVPDLRENGIPDDVSVLIETAMNRDRHRRPSAAAFEEALRQAERRHGSPVGEVALRTEPSLDRREPEQSVWGRRSPGPVGKGSQGDMPWEPTSFVNRRTEVAGVKNLLSTSRLVTLTGIGGVGKTRLALRAASNARRGFAEGMCLVELADVSDASLLVDVIAAAIGVRDETATPLMEVVVQFLSSQEMLLVADNCEHMIEAVAALAETLLRTCPGLRILATSREPLNVAGEAVLRLSPLSVPDPGEEPTLRGLPRFDAVTLFTDRATSAVPGFRLDEDNKTAVARICARLDGLPLAIELAAARMSVMSPQQILQRLDDRYALLTRGRRTAPTRQQTLRWSVDWSYELCSPPEQRLWARLSVFASGFELDAVEQICCTGLTNGSKLDPGGRSPLDVLSSLVDKSILIRGESDAAVRFRMLETLRDYGREKLQESGEDIDLRRRHRDWYQRLALDAEAGWISDQQTAWIARLEREQPNLREALEFCISENTEEAAEAGLRTAAALLEFWVFRGLYGEGRSWLHRLLARFGTRSVAGRVEALDASSQMAATQGDFQSAAAFLKEERRLGAQSPTPTIQAHIDYADGLLALVNGEPDRASTSLERVVEELRPNGALPLRARALAALGWAYEVCGDQTRALECYELLGSLTEARGESLYRSLALRGMGVALWQQGEEDRAEGLLEEAARVAQRVKSPVLTAFSLEALAWFVGFHGSAERAAVLMGAAQGLWPTIGQVATVLMNMSRFHEECEQMARGALGTHEFNLALRQGRAMDMGTAVAYALGEQATKSAHGSGARSTLTKRERQVADLIAQGLSNKQIAAKLVVSQRTAEGHVEHILTKLGFSSRAQIAAWAVEKKA